MENATVNNEYVAIHIEDGIMHSVYKPDLVINLEIAKLLVRERLKICNKKTYPLFVDVSNLLSIDMEAREYFAGEEATRFISAGAIYSRSPIAKFAGKLFLDVNQPKTPSQIFTNKEEAIAWLHQFIKKK